MLVEYYKHNDYVFHHFDDKGEIDTAALSAIATVPLKALSTCNLCCLASPGAIKYSLASVCNNPRICKPFIFTSINEGASIHS